MRILSLHEDLVLAVCLILRERRELMDISQSDLARRSGLHRSYIGDLERGSRNISVRNLSRLAEAMGLPASKLLALAEKKLESNLPKRKVPIALRGAKTKSSRNGKRPLDAKRLDSKRLDRKVIDARASLDSSVVGKSKSMRPRKTVTTRRIVRASKSK